MSEHSLRVDQVSKIYDLPSGPLKVLDNISFEVLKGQSLAIVGPSGSGKSTLLGLCAGLDYASEGAIHILGEELSKLSENDKAALRAGRMGFVFQAYQLVPTLTALENAMVPGELQGKTAGLREKASEMLDRLGLPNGIAIDDENNIYLADARNSRILRYPAIDFEALPEVAPAGGEAEEEAP